MRNLLTVSHAPDRSYKTESDRRAGCGSSQESTRHQRSHVRTAWTLLRLHADGRPQQRPQLARRKAGRDISPGISPPRPTPKRRSMERPPDGHEIFGPEATKTRVGTAASTVRRAKRAQPCSVLADTSFLRTPVV